MGFNLLVRPAVGFDDDMECQSSSTSTREHHQEGQKEREGAHNCKNIDDVIAVDLKLKIPSCDIQEVDESDSDECKTPTSSDHRIPSSPPCPSAPKKPKSHPLRKRKSCVVSGNFLDLSKDIENLFPAPLLLDLYGKVKKVRRTNSHE